jgi:exosortase H (IPTLxxWG-CTERM-specific)
MTQGWRSRIDPASLKFVSIFLFLVFGLTLLIQNTWIDEHLVGPYTEVLAGIGGAVLGALGRQVAVAGTIIREGSFAVDIRRGCDGIVATILLVSACLAYPLSWKDRLLGTALGYGLIFVLNMVRIVALFVIGVQGSMQAFDFFHTYVSQFAVIALTMVFWIYWASRQTKDLKP